MNPAISAARRSVGRGLVPRRETASRGDEAEGDKPLPYRTKKAECIATDRLDISLIPLLLAALLLSCAAPGAGQPSGGAATSAGPTTPKRIVAVMQGDPVAVMNVAELGGANVPGTDALSDLLSAGLTGTTPNGLRAQLAEAVPSFENGLWKLSPDGQMETTWHLQPGARWHDGTPFSTDDALFTAQVVRDRELPNFRDPLFELISSVEAPDPRTIVVHWKSPSIDADALFSVRGRPLPKHLLEQGYAEQKPGFMRLPYWSDGFVGTGPFKIRSWERGSHLVLDANPNYVLGRPRVDEVEVRFIADRAALAASFLAGAVELTLSRGLSVDEALAVASQWRDGQLLPGFVDNAYQVYPQSISPSPATIGDVRFRQAMLQAIDRQQMVETFMAGQTSVMHTFVSPGQPEYEDIERGVVHYDYDPRRAAQTIEGLGYQRTADGGFRDATGNALAVELRNFGVGGEATFAVGNYWQRLGVPTEVVIIPEQRSRDNEYRALFPGFQLLQNPNDVRALPRLQSSQVPLPENNYVANANKSRYMNPEFDALIDRYFATIPRAERIQVLGQIVRHIAEQLPLMGLFYSTQPTLVSNRVSNVMASTALTNQAWNAEQWDVRS